MSLAKKSCEPCKGGTPPLTEEEQKTLSRELDKEWEIKKGEYLERTYLFPNFQSALDFVNLIGAIAEKENHHPDIFLTYGKVILKIWTHKIHGLTKSDFYLAAKYDELTRNQ